MYIQSFFSAAMLFKQRSGHNGILDMLPMTPAIYQQNVSRWPFLSGAAKLCGFSVARDNFPFPLPREQDELEAAACGQYI